MQTIDFLAQFIAIPSVSTQEQEASAFLVKAMLEFGFDQAFVDGAGNAVGVRGIGKRQIVLLGHIDTVPGEIPVEIKENKLYGRGSVDAKGPLAAFTLATAALSDEELEGKQIVVIGAVEEEITTSKGARFVLDTYTPDFCIIGEPSSWDKITLGYKGIVNYDIHISQSITHHALAEQTATKQAIKFLCALEHFLEPFQKERTFESPTLEIRTIQTEDNGITQTVTAKIAVRVPPDFDHYALKHFIETNKGNVSLTCTQELQGIATDKQNDLVTAFLNGIRDAGGKPGFVKKTGSSDMCIAGPQWKCPIVAYGPGDSKLDHTPEEHVDLGEFEKGVVVLRNTLSAV
ncbi:MAG: [LysW]-lysine hydrolase [bacterium]